MGQAPDVDPDAFGISPASSERGGPKDMWAVTYKGQTLDRFDRLADAEADMLDRHQRSRAEASNRDRCAEHEGLLAAAQRCVQARNRFLDDSTDHHRARWILAAMASHCRYAANVFAIDPTLASEPYNTGRFRSIDLLAEMARQVKPLLVQACDPRDTGRMRPRQERWDEVEALFDRAKQIARTIVDVVPRHDHDTELGSRAISRDRLAANAHELADAAAQVRAACGAAQYNLPHVDPTVHELTAIARQLEQHATDLAAHAEKSQPDGIA